jgi:hypothetical protein
MALWQKLVVMAAAAAGAGIAYVFARGDQSTESIAQNARNEILSIKQRIVTAQGRLKNLEKANRGKQAKVQRKLIEQLNAQRRALERTQQNAEKSGGKSGGKSGRRRVRERSPSGERPRRAVCRSTSWQGSGTRSGRARSCTATKRMPSRTGSLQTS